MEIVLVVPIICKNSALPRDIEEAEKLMERRNDMLSKGYTIKETQLVVFSDFVYAHYVFMKEEKANC